MCPSVEKVLKRAEGTMTDDEMRAMPVPRLQDDGGLIFVWVTGRALDLGRECLRHWGRVLVSLSRSRCHHETDRRTIHRYERIEEIVWIKINQLQRLIRTGRTGHYLSAPSLSPSQSAH